MSYTPKGTRSLYGLLVVAYLGYAALLTFGGSIVYDIDSVPLWLFLLAAPGLAIILVRLLVSGLSSWAGTPGTKRRAAIKTLLEPAGYTVLNEVDLAKGVVDQVVIGPSGIYAVKAKSWRTTASLGDGGRLTHGLGNGQIAKSQALDAATLVRRRLASCGIDHVIIPVITAPKVRGGRINARDVQVVQQDLFGVWVKGRGMKIVPAEVDRVRLALTPFNPNDMDSLFKTT